jgi:methylenetetrahydrofolate dehydrogenase (NADP+)/methenyltetrahydrofolate cyclohydrolase
MIKAQTIDGKLLAAKICEEVRDEVKRLKDTTGITPGLSVIIVGNNPASEVYVRNKIKQAAECGINSQEFKLPEIISEGDLIAKVEELNNDPAVHGILVQLPLPAHISEDKVIQIIHPNKDVDGFHISNSGKLMKGMDTLVPCTPQGCMIMLKRSIGDLSGKHAVVIGRSNIVGKPMAMLLLQENCTVTIAHSKTHNLAAICATADILIAAVGRPEIVKGDWVKPGAVVIDVGINRIERDGKMILVGDVDFAEASQRASFITPVPGGVGPMTIACLLKNTVKAARVLSA